MRRALTEIGCPEMQCIGVEFGTVSSGYYIDSLCPELAFNAAAIEAIEHFGAHFF